MNSPLFFNDTLALNRCCVSIATLAGLYLAEEISCRNGASLPSGTVPHDPFLDGLGGWDAERQEVVVDITRCSKASRGIDPLALATVVATHFCARAVVHLGKHPKTKLIYQDWGKGRRFVDEAYSLRPTHRLYDALIREQILFTQIFTRLHLLQKGCSKEVLVFDRLSQGHCGLYDLDYGNTEDSHLVEAMLRRDWRIEASNAPLAAITLGQRTRGTMIELDDLSDIPIDP